MQPLVSIIVITYNSAETVLETLDSAKNQTYKNLELIITDDGSKDKTVEICKEWLQENRNRFERTELLTVEKNSGIPANCNRGVKVASGKWVKFIAGDDLLAKNCIETFMSYINSRQEKDYNFLIGKLELFNENGVFSTWPEYNFPAKQRQQFIRQIFGGFIKAPGTFMRVKCLENLGWFNEKYHDFEDDPMWYKYLASGYCFEFVNEVVVKYRVGHASVSNGNVRFGGMSEGFFKTYKRFKYDLIKSLVSKFEITAAILLLLDITFQRLSYNSSNFIRRYAIKCHSKVKTAEKLLISNSR